MKSGNEAVLTDQSPKLRRPKSREITSRFLSQSSTPSREIGNSSPNQALSPVRSGKPSTPPDTRNHRSLDQDSGGFIRGLWPSSTTSRSASSSLLSNKNLGTLAEHLGNERLKDHLQRQSDEKPSNNDVFSLSRQRSCTESSRFENDPKEKESAKENHRPFLGGYMRYTGKLRFLGKSSSSSSSLSSSSSSSSNALSHKSGIVPGRMSVDERALYRNSHSRSSDILMENLESESECSDVCSATDFSSPAIGRTSSHSQSCRRSGIEVSSKYIQDIPNKPRRMNSDNIQNTVSLDSSPRMKKFTIKNAIKRANSLTGYGSATSQWALSPGRSGSPPMSVESKERPMSFSSLKPPNSPSRPKGVEKLLSNLGLDLFKSKKTSSSPLATGDAETVHQLRMLYNRLLQWRYANARADAVDAKFINQMQNNLLCAWDAITKLRQSMLHKKLQLQKEKLEMKLEFILRSQINALESWGDMERQHLSAVAMMKECMHSVVCRIPLIEGAKMDPQSATVLLRHALDLTASIKSILASFSPSEGRTISLLSELAETVAQEQLLMEDCLELGRTIALLEMEERSLKCYIIQSKSCQQLKQQHQQEEISS